MKIRIVLLSSTVIFTAVSYDVFNFHYIHVTLVFVYYVNMFAQRTARYCSISLTLPVDPRFFQLK